MAGRDDFTIGVRADDQASDELADIADRAEALERLDPDVDVTVDGAKAKRELQDLQGEADQLTDDLQAASRVDFSALSAGLGGPGGVAAGAAGIGAALFANNDAWDQRVIQAQAMADSFGLSVEDASRLQTLFRRAGLDANDLFDILADMSGELSDQPELVARLGINLRDGVIPAFFSARDAVRSIEDPLERSRIAQRLFGEEGVRQIGYLEARVGDLRAAFAAVPAELVDTADDVARARENLGVRDEAVESWEKLTKNVNDFANSRIRDADRLISLVTEEQKGLAAASEVADGWLQRNIDSFRGWLGFAPDVASNADEVAAALGRLGVEASGTVAGWAEAELAAQGTATSFGDATRALRDVVDELGSTNLFRRAREARREVERGLDTDRDARIDVFIETFGRYEAEQEIDQLTRDRTVNISYRQQGHPLGSDPGYVQGGHPGNQSRSTAASLRRYEYRNGTFTP